MPHETKNFVSPRYTHEKLDSRSYPDIVDVFEDRMLNWLIEPAKKLLELEHGAIAAVALALSYFEGIEIYYSGEDSVNRSKEFFRRGFQRVFVVDPSGVELYDKITDAIYIQARCGFAHDGLFRNRVFFSTALSKPITVTWPKKDGVFDTSGNFESVIINPHRFVDGIADHFARYVGELRSDTNAQLKSAFLAAVELRWGLDEPDRHIGMTEEEFTRGA